MSAPDKFSLELQEKIVKKYPARSRKYRIKLCRKCSYYFRSKCTHSLIPVTIKGKECPYFNMKEGGNGTKEA
ncbi:MAG: hypothetical protein WC359_12380 [Dehalococcoidia bacterium]